MTAVTAAPSQELVFLSEVFPLSIVQSNLACYEVMPEIDQETGNRLSFHLSRKLEDALRLSGMSDDCGYSLQTSDLNQLYRSVRRHSQLRSKIFLIYATNLSSFRVMMLEMQHQPFCPSLRFRF